MAQLTQMENLSEEIIESIAELLDLYSACNLRLTSRIMYAKTSCGHFRSYFRSKQLDLTVPEELRQFQEQTKPDRMGRLLQNLTISANVNPVSGESLFEDLCKNLGQGLSNLRTLDQITLQVLRQDDAGKDVLDPNMFPDWIKTWTTASNIFKSTMVALRDTQLTMGTMDVFCSVLRCSLACDQLHWATSGTVYPDFSKLTNLSLSLSHRMAENKSVDVLSNGRSEVVSIATSFSLMLDRCPALEMLHLHWHSLKWDALPDDEYDDAYFLNFLEHWPELIRLKSCVLRGLRSDANSLLRFLHTAPLRNVTLEEVHVIRGTYRPLFDHFVDHCVLEKLHLENLGENGKICILDTGEAHSRRSHPNGPTRLVRFGRDARNPIRYKHRQGRTIATSAGDLANAKRTLEFGPPNAVILTGHGKKLFTKSSSS